MTRRTFGIVVIVWVAAAVAAGVWTLGRQADPGFDRDAARALPSSAESRASFETEDTLPSALAQVSVEPVEGGWTGPGGREFFVAIRSQGDRGYLHRPFGQEVFALGLRLDDPGPGAEGCSSCHVGRDVVDGRRGADAAGVHQNVRPVHPARTGAQCLTCHQASNVEQVRLEGGGSASLDHAYRMCAQCHFQQVDAWAYGAHGKRLVGWRGRRVVMGCADCHDPHSPATEVRPPMAGLELPGPLNPSGRREGAGHD